MAGTVDIVTVFVVDDDEPVRDSIKVLLEIYGYEVADFVSTSEFVANYRKPPRGCLILDQHLPVMTGLEFLATASGRNLGIPVILITGHTDPRLEQRAREAGVADYLEKPVRKEVLIDAVERVVNMAS